VMDWPVESQSPVLNHCVSISSQSTTSKIAQIVQHKIQSFKINHLKI